MGMNTSHLRFLTVLWIVLSVPFPTKPTLVTVPLIVEGNAPIIELEFPMQSGKLRKARFLVDTGGGALLLGNKLMADVGAKADGPPIEDEGSPIQPLIPMQVELCGMALDLTGVSVAGLPASEWAGPRNEAEGIIPASLLAITTSCLIIRDTSLVWANQEVSNFKAQRFPPRFLRTRVFPGSKPPSRTLNSASSSTRAEVSQ